MHMTVVWNTEDCSEHVNRVGRIHKKLVEMLLDQVGIAMMPPGLFLMKTRSYAYIVDWPVSIV